MYSYQLSLSIQILIHYLLYVRLKKKREKKRDTIASYLRVNFFFMEIHKAASADRFCSYVRIYLLSSQPPSILDVVAATWRAASFLLLSDLYNNRYVPNIAYRV